MAIICSAIMLCQAIHPFQNSSRQNQRTPRLGRVAARDTKFIVHLAKGSVARLRKKATTHYGWPPLTGSAAISDIMSFITDRPGFVFVGLGARAKGKHEP